MRHAVPLVVAAATLGGAAIAEAWRRRSRAALAGVAVLFVAASAMRLWEYHNELVGGSSGAYRYFANEELDLGQQTKTPLDPAFAQQLRAQIARIETGEDPSRLQPLRDPWLE